MPEGVLGIITILLGFGVVIGTLVALFEGPEDGYVKVTLPATFVFVGLLMWAICVINTPLAVEKEMTHVSSVYQENIDGKIVQFFMSFDDTVMKTTETYENPEEYNIVSKKTIYSDWCCGVLLQSKKIVLDYTATKKTE